MNDRINEVEVYIWQLVRHKTKDWFLLLYLVERKQTWRNKKQSIKKIKKVTALLYYKPEVSFLSRNNVFHQAHLRAFRPFMYNNHIPILVFGIKRHVQDLNPEPLPFWASVIPLDQQAM